MEPIFWLRRAALGRVHMCLGRNDAIYQRQQSRASVHVLRDGRNLFSTFRIGSRFLNVDLV